jgi:hypothetical protein
MKANGLELKQINTKAESLNNINGDNLNSVLAKHFDTPSFAVAYLDYKVLIGRWENNAFYFYNNEEFENKYI